MADTDDKIKESLDNTLNRRNNQQCKTVQLKIQRNHLSTTSKKYLKTIFDEAKWFYNTIIESGNVYTFDTKINKVNVFNSLTRNFDSHDLEFLSSQMKQGILKIMQNNQKTLDRYQNGKKLKFKSEINSIPLKQYGNTYHFKGNYIKIQNAPTKLKINGLQQIKGEIANAFLVKDKKDYYINVIVFEDNNEIVIPNERNEDVKISNSPIKMYATPKLKKFGQRVKYSDITKVSRPIYHLYPASTCKSVCKPTCKPSVSSSFSLPSPKTTQTNTIIDSTSNRATSLLKNTEPLKVDRPSTPKSVFEYNSVAEMLEDCGSNVSFLFGNAPSNPKSCVVHDSDDCDDYYDEDGNIINDDVDNNSCHLQTSWSATGHSAFSRR